MSQPHQHPNGAAPTPPQDQTVLRARDASIIAQKNARLEQRSKEIRELERHEEELVALSNDLYSEVLGLRAMIDQITAENHVLRRRLDLPEVGAIEPLPGDVADPEPELQAVTLHNMDEPQGEPGN